MIDPRPYFPAITAAYASLASPPPGHLVVDVFTGMDLNGRAPQAVVMQGPDGVQRIGFAGTRNWEQWIEDADAFPIPTRLGFVADGIWGTYDTLETASGVPLSTYCKARPAGHSRGAPMAALWAVEYSSPEYALFACPRLLGSSILFKLALLDGMAWATLGDLVPKLAPEYQAMPAVTMLTAPAAGRPLTIPEMIAYRHEWTTYQAGLNALFQPSNLHSTAA